MNTNTVWATCHHCNRERVATYPTNCGLRLCAICDIRHTAEHTCKTNPEAAKIAWGTYEVYR